MAKAKSTTRTPNPHSRADYTLQTVLDRAHSVGSNIRDDLVYVRDGKLYHRLAFVSRVVIGAPFHLSIMPAHSGVKQYWYEDIGKLITKLSYVPAEQEGILANFIDTEHDRIMGVFERAVITAAKNIHLAGIIGDVPRPVYRVNYDAGSVEHMIDWLNETTTGLILDPDYQRGHVWSTEQQKAYVEALISGRLSDVQRTLQFNSVDWDDGHLDAPIEIFDGKQRLHAIRTFVAGGLEIFTGMRFNDFVGTRYSLTRGTNTLLTIVIYSIKNRAALLSYYLDINRGGTIHGDAEITRVTELLNTELNKQKDATC